MCVVGDGGALPGPPLLKCSITATFVLKLVHVLHPDECNHEPSTFSVPCERDKAAASQLTSLWSSSRTLSGHTLYDSSLAAAGYKASLTASYRLLWCCAAPPALSTQAVTMSQTSISTKNFTTRRWTRQVTAEHFIAGRHSG